MKQKQAMEAEAAATANQVAQMQALSAQHNSPVASAPPHSAPSAGAGAGAAASSSSAASGIPVPPALGNDGPAPPPVPMAAESADAASNPFASSSSSSSSSAAPVGARPGSAASDLMEADGASGAAAGPPPNDLEL